MDRLERLENQSIYILREAYASFPHLCMLWSIGKDSTVLLWLARKAFLGSIPFPLVHIDTGFKIPEMIRYRDQRVQDWQLDMIVGKNQLALDQKQTFPDGKLNRLDCCQLLKTRTLLQTIEGNQIRYRYDHLSQSYKEDRSFTRFDAVIAGIRADEEGSRSKERYFSQRNTNNKWTPGQQEPEFWDYYKLDFAPDSHIRVHPLLDWTELDIWQYIDDQEIPTLNLYYDQGEGLRYRSLGCYPCTQQIRSSAKDAKGVVKELCTGPLKQIPERSGRAQDSEDGGGLETLRRGGYM